YSARPWPSSWRSHLSGRIDMWRPPVVLLGPAQALSATIGPGAVTTIGALWSGGHAVRPSAAAHRRGGSGGVRARGGKLGAILGERHGDARRMCPLPHGLPGSRRQLAGAGDGLGGRGGRAGAPRADAQVRAPPGEAPAHARRRRGEEAGDGVVDAPEEPALEVRAEPPVLAD